LAETLALSFPNEGATPLSLWKADLAALSFKCNVDCSETTILTAFRFNLMFCIAADARRGLDTPSPVVSPGQGSWIRGR
jgi:hypothetical protein